MESGRSRSPARAGIPVTVTEPAWRRLIRGPDALAARAALAAGGVGAVVLADDRTVKRLNTRFRGRNKPTNVLTFEPAGEEAAGEVILALGTLRREAAAASRRPAHHLAHLIVHGALHLSGHDHQRAGEARRMEMAEARILRRLRVPNPWKRA